MGIPDSIKLGKGKPGQPGSSFGRAEVFQLIYDINEWNGKETRAGQWSDLPTVQKAIDATEAALGFTKADSLLDIGCSEGYWQAMVPTLVDGSVSYAGIDIVEPAIALCRQRFPYGLLMVADAVESSLPQADLILLRDTHLYLPTDDVLKLLERCCTKGNWLLATTYNTPHNTDCLPGSFRPLNLKKYLGKPMVFYPEDYRRYLSLWKL